MSAYTLDTSALLRFFLADNAEQAIAVRECLTRAREGKVTVSIESSVFIETLYMLMTVYNIEKEKVVSVLRSVVSITYITIPGRELLEQALAVFSQSSVTFIDALLLAHAKATKADVYTFDTNTKNEAVRIGVGVFGRT